MDYFDDSRRRLVIQVIGMAGMIILLASMECIMVLYASRDDDDEIPEDTVLRFTVEKFVDSVKDVISAMQDTSPSTDLEIAAQAIEAIEKDEGFSTKDITDAVLVITEDSTIARAYLSITNKGVRTALLRHCMKRFKKDN